MSQNIIIFFSNTDSMLFMQKKDKKELKGDYLGYLTNESPPGYELAKAVAIVMELISH